MSTSPEKKPLRRLTSTDVRPSLLSAALDYHSRGFCPIPQRPREKRPCVRWKPFQVERPTVADLEYWFGSRFPAAGVALIVGPVSGLFIVDVDGPAGDRELLARVGELPVAPTVISGSLEPHRYHLFFRYPADVLTLASFKPWHPQLEFRGDRGVIVVPPSLHPSGNRYRWAKNRTLDDLPLPEVPLPILAALRARARSSARSRPGEPAPTHAAPVTPEQSSVNALAIDLLDGISDDTRFFLLGLEATGPNWNAKLFRASCDMKGCGFPEEEAMPMLLRGARPWTGHDRAAAEATIRSAYSQVRLAARHRAVEARMAARPNSRCFSFTIPVKKHDPSAQGGQPA
jgi:hypothetical protein